MQKLNYELVKVDDLQRHPLHKQTFLDPEEKQPQQKWLERTVNRYGKLKPVFYVEVDVDGQIQKQVIDGWATVDLYHKNGTESIVAAKVDLDSVEDIMQVMVELQFSNHNSLQEECKIYQALYDVFRKGQGSRTDLVEIEKSPEEVGIDKNEKKKRKDSIFQFIGKMTGASAKRVMYILTVGKLNPWYFERIENERYSLYAAYLDCKDEKKGVIPPVPTVKAPVYESDTTEIPEYTGTTSTDNQSEEAIATTDFDESIESMKVTSASYLQPKVSIANENQSEETLATIDSNESTQYLKGTGNAHLQPIVSISNDNPVTSTVEIKINRNLLDIANGKKFIPKITSINNDSEEFIIVSVKITKS